LKQEVVKKSSKRKCKLGLFVCVVLSVILLTGCFAKGYTREEAEAQVELGKEIFNEYLEENYEGAKIKEIEVHDDLRDEWLLTDYVEGLFEYKDRYYLFAVNTVSEEIYTSVEYDTFVATCQDVMIETLELEYDSLKCTHFSYDLLLPATDDPSHALYGENTKLSNLLPVDVDVDTYAREQLKKGNQQIVIELSYFGDKQIIDYNFVGTELEMFPGLSFIRLNHMRDAIYVDEFYKDYFYWLDGKYVNREELEKTGKIEYVYDYMCSETVVLNGTIEYREWMEYEKDGFIICYTSLYMKEDKMYDENQQETGEVITTEYFFEPETDFTVNVTEEYIRVDIPEDSEMLYYIYLDNLDVVDSEEKVVFESETKAKHARYEKKEWEYILGKYVLTNYTPEECNKRTIGRFFFGEGAKKLYDEVE